MNKKSDSEIKRQVLLELTWDSRVPSSEIGVEVFEGVVTLTRKRQHLGDESMA